MKKILVTGAVGQVGRFLVRKMLEMKSEFSGLDIVNPTNLPNFKFLRADIRNTIELERLRNSLKDFDTVIHLASVVEADQNVVKNGLESVELNTKGTLNLLKYLPNLNQFCFASTYMVYGSPLSNPVTENHPTEPNNIYGASKLITEKFLQVFAQNKGINLSILRFMGIYGLESPYAIQAIPIFIKKITNNESPILFGSGKVRRNHIYIDDAINAIMVCMDAQKSGVFNIGGSDAPSNLELVKIINEKMGKDIKPVLKESATKQYDFITDVSLANNVLGFKPLMGIREGIAKTIEQYRSSGK
jgi:UDP-glucose 4-epimerase